MRRPSRLRGSRNRPADGRRRRSGERPGDTRRVPDRRFHAARPTERVEGGTRGASGRARPRLGRVRDRIAARLGRYRRGAAERRARPARARPAHARALRRDVRRRSRRPRHRPGAGARRRGGTAAAGALRRARRGLGPPGACVLGALGLREPGRAAEVRAGRRRCRGSGRPGAAAEPAGGLLLSGSGGGGGRRRRIGRPCVRDLGGVRCLAARGRQAPAGGAARGGRLLRIQLRRRRHRARRRGHRGDRAAGRRGDPDLRLSGRHRVRDAASRSRGGGAGRRRAGVPVPLRRPGCRRVAPEAGHPGHQPHQPLWPERGRVARLRAGAVDVRGDVPGCGPGAGGPGGAHRGGEQGAPHGSGHRVDDRRQSADSAPRRDGGPAGAGLRGARSRAERRQARGRSLLQLPAGEGGHRRQLSERRRVAVQRPPTHAGGRLRPRRKRSRSVVRSAPRSG